MTSLQGLYYSVRQSKLGMRWTRSASKQGNAKQASEPEEERLLGGAAVEPRLRSEVLFCNRQNLEARERGSDFSALGLLQDKGSLLAVRSVAGAAVGSFGLPSVVVDSRQHNKI